ncbi:superinfection immunity protein [Caldisericum sp.]|uniref:superinfection immunity protein n=1 Tax=Caldisericum sp. TaxID=2499687 RepID=UPI003D12E68E
MLTAIIIIIGIVIGMVVYFLPSIIAFRNNNAHPVIVFLINLFAGVTVAGWLIALAFAIFGKEKHQEGGYR